MTTPALAAYQQGTALAAAPLTVACPYCREQPGNPCRSRTGAIDRGFHAAREQAVAHLTNAQKLEAVAAMRARQEQRRQEAIAALDMPRPAPVGWDTINQQERRS